MKRLEKENFNTQLFYNHVLRVHYEEVGLDFSDFARIKLLLKLYSGGALLDIGCGISPLCLEASQLEKGEVWGIDFAGEMIKKLQEDYPQIHYVEGELLGLPFKEEQFDYVALGEILEHTENPKAVIKEAFRVLKTGGFLALSVPNKENAATHKDKQHLWSFQGVDMSYLVGDDKIIGVSFWSNNIICYAKK